MADLQTQLLAMAEPEYRAFQQKLLPHTENILGVRLPRLRGLARQIAKDDWKSWLNLVKNQSFEETMLEGMVLGYVRCPLEELLPFIRRFVRKIDNWSVCDSFCSGLKLPRAHPREMWEFLLPYLQAKEEFSVRFGVVMLLFYYSGEQYLARTLEALSRVRHPGYYAQMAVAWAYSICYAKYPNQTFAFLSQTPLDFFIRRKTVQKIRESRAVSPEDKKAALALSAQALKAGRAPETS